MLPDILLKHKCDNINKLVITLAFVGEKMIGGWKLYGLMNSLKWINASKYKAATARIPPILTYREKEREFRHTKTENPFMFVFNYLSLNTKSGYKDFRSLWYLIDKVLSFAVLSIPITSRGHSM